MADAKDFSKHDDKKNEVTKVDPHTSTPAKANIPTFGNKEAVAPGAQVLSSGNKTDAKINNAEPNSNAPDRSQPADANKTESPLGLPADATAEKRITEQGNVAKDTAGPSFTNADASAIEGKQPFATAMPMSHEAPLSDKSSEELPPNLPDAINKTRANDQRTVNKAHSMQSELQSLPIAQKLERISVLLKNGGMDTQQQQRALKEIALYLV